MLNRIAFISKRTLLPLLLILFLSALAPTAAAQLKSFHWTEWNIDVVLQPDGSLAVTETQTLDFSGAPFTFGFRSIPVGRAGNNDGIRDVSVREGDLVYRESSSNAAGTFEVVDQGDETRINWYFDPALGENTYTFSYIVDGAVRAGTADEGSGDQIFWTVIPSDAPARIDASRTTITLPEGVYPQRFTGTEDYLVEAYINDVATSDVAITVSEDERTIVYETLRALMPGEKLDVRVQFPHGLLPIVTPAWQASEQRDDVVGLGVLAVSLLLLVGGPLGVLLLWYLRGRDPQLGIVVPDYVTEPPDALPPAIVGALIDEKVDMQDIISTLIDLAHRGYLTMEEKEKRGYQYTRTAKPDSDLREYERTFLARVFRGEETRSLSSLQNKFYSAIPELKRQIDEAIVAEGLLPRAPQNVRTIYTVLAAAVLVLGVASLFLIGIFLGNNAGLACFPMMAIVGTAIALFIAARHMPRKTAKGAEAAAKWQAFKTYLKNIKEYADIEQSGDIFDKYLAYAVAFGLERSFINTFSQATTTPIPPWYTPFPTMGHPMGGGMGPVIMGGPRPSGGGSVGGGMPSLGDISGGLTGGLAGMSAGLTRMLNNASSTMRSSPPPANSGSSGSFGGGGGFSGGFSGGFGGGSSGGGGGAGFG
jgi:uncharacterized protein (TIGR04222 family)